MLAVSHVNKVKRFQNFPFNTEGSAEFASWPFPGAQAIVPIGVKTHAPSPFLRTRSKGQQAYHPPLDCPVAAPNSVYPVLGSPSQGAVGAYLWLFGPDGFRSHSQGL